MNCPHDISEREVAVVADGYCPLCMAVDIGRLREAFRVNMLRLDPTISHAEIDRILALATSPHRPGEG